MAKKQLNTIKLGVFIIVAFVLFTYGLYRIGDRQSFLSKNMTVYVDFKDIKGLRPGNNVRYSGITIGSVETINILNDTTLRVGMAIQSDAVKYLRKNAQAEIGSSGLVGNMLVNIGPGTGPSSPVGPGDILAANQAVEMNEMVDLLAASNQRIEQITDQLLQITEKINQGQGSLALLLNDAQMASHLEQSMAQMAATTQALNTASQNLAAATTAVNTGEGNLGYLLRDTSLKQQMGQLSNNLDTLISVRTGPVLDSITLLAASLAEASRNIQQLTTQLEASEGIIPALLSDSSLSSALQTTLQNLERGTYKLDENMKALQYSWPFKKYFRQQQKQQQ